MAISLGEEKRRKLSTAETLHFGGRSHLIYRMGSSRANDTLLTVDELRNVGHRAFEVHQEANGYEKCQYDRSSRKTLPSRLSANFV